MSDQEPVDLADIARRAGVPALAALIEAARSKPSAVTVAAAKALIELGHDADGGGSPAHPTNVVVRILPGDREIGERLERKLDDLAERAQKEPNCPTCGRARTSEAEAPPAAPIVTTLEPGPSRQPSATDSRVESTIRPTPPPRSSEPPPPPLKCQICGGVGHLPIGCPERDAFMDSQPWTRVVGGEW